MERSALTVDPARLKSPLLPAAAVICILTALMGIPGVVLLFSPDYAEFLLRDMAAGGITDQSSLRSWRMINSFVTLFICLTPALMAGGLTVAHKGRPVRGFGFLGNVAQWLLYGVYASGALCIPILLIRFFRFLILNSKDPSGIVAIYSMLISEGLMVTQAVFLFFLIQKFLNCCIDTATSIAYTMATGKLDDRSIPGLPATGFLVLALTGIVLAINRLFTLTVVVNVVQSYYKLLVATHPALWAEAACLILGSTACILLHLYLRRYKKFTERAIFEARKSP